MLLYVRLKREKVISGVKRDYQMQNEYLHHLQTKILMCAFQQNIKLTKTYFGPGWQLSRKKQVNRHAGNYCLSAPGNQLDNGRRNAKLMAHVT